MNTFSERDGVWFVYDGECPLCTSAAQAFRIKKEYGSLHLVNARDVVDNPLIHEINRRGFDLDEGMVIYASGDFYHGEEALRFMAQCGQAQNLFTALCKSLFWSEAVSSLTYPWMRGIRNLLIGWKNAGRINNLGLNNQPNARRFNSGTLQTLALLLPALIPSWRFFQTIAPSPRIEFALLKTMQGKDSEWQEFRPRPLKLSVFDMLRRMVWNPRWNESLFLVSCSERLIHNPNEHTQQEIFNRIAAELKRNPIDIAATPYLQFRLVFINRNGGNLEKHVLFTSPIQKYFEGSEV